MPIRYPTCRHSLRSATVLVAAVGLVGGMPGFAGGQPEGDSGQSTPASITLDPLDPLDITGHTFSRLRLPLAPVPGIIEFAANRVHVWVEQDAGMGAGIPTQRLLLEGDVTVMLGGTLLHAERAVVWLEKLSAVAGESNAPQQTTTHQVYIYFDSVGSIAADAGSSLRAHRLSVDGVVMSGQPIRLAADLTKQGRPADAFLRESEREFTRYLRELATGAPVAIEDVDAVDIAPESGTGTPGRYPLPTVESNLLRAAPVLADAGDELFAKEGIISFDPGQIALVTGDSGRSLLLTEGVKVLYRDTKSTRQMQMSAQRAVVFLSDGTVADLGQFKPEDIEGLYLEGDVNVTDGKYTIRGPRIYYDVSRDRAMLVDSVFWTFDTKLGVPLYVRAEALRQQSTSEFVATQATIANTRFARPHMSIGASTVTIKQYTRADGSTGNRVDARGLTARAGSVPFLYWPVWVGDPERFPLRNFQFSSSSFTGPVWQTAWDLHTLLGLDQADGIDSTFLIDYYAERGFAIGTDTTWRTAQMRGGVFAYLLFDDNGEDVTPSGRRVDVTGETRSIILAENRWRLNSLWSITAEGAYISDPRFLTALWPKIADESRELTTRARLERTDENSQFAFEAKSNLNDFIANHWLLQSRGYSVDNLPEISYVRTLDDISGALPPGTITLNSEYRLGQLAMNFNDPEVRELGFVFSNLSQAAFGIDPTESIADALRARGLREEGVYRLDTRHEVSAVLDKGPIRINPFAVARFTAYDSDFKDYSPDEGDNARAWGAAGVRLSTSLQRVDNTVDSTFFDLHRVRHIIEPGITIWHAGSTVDRVDLPVFDDAVESLAEGTIVRVGLDQTWQTKRGGPGRWRNVDVLKLRTEYVWASGDSDRESPIGRFYEDRPELSSVGEFLDAELLWQVSDPIGITGRIIYDIEDTRQPSYSTFGVLIDHGYGFRSSLGQRFVNALDSTVVFYNMQYQLTDKYRMPFATNYDTALSDLERISTSFTRSYSNVTVGLTYSFNNITDESSIGFILSPKGLRGGFGVRTGATDNDRGSDLGG